MRKRIKKILEDMANCDECMLNDHHMEHIRAIEDILDEKKISDKQILTGVINIYTVHSELIDKIFQDGVDLDYLQYIEENGKNAAEDYECENPTILLGFKKDDNDEWDTDEDAEYSLKYNGNQATIQVVHSKYIKKNCAICSPCYPGQADLESIGDLTAYALNAGDISKEADKFTKSGIFGLVDLK